MLIWPILLRIVLTAGLILNGSGHAEASVHAHAGVDRSTTRSAATCHVELSIKSPGQLMADSGMAQAKAKEVPPEHPSRDACQAEDCGCAQQSAAAVISGMHGRDPVIARGRGIGVMASGRASPMLPNLIRPPIG